MDKLRIVIVGGVAGGASAAARARRINEHAEIIVFEKDEHVSFANCGLPYYIGDEIQQREKLLVATPEFLRTRFRLDVRTFHEVIGIDRTRKTVRVRDLKAATEFDQPYDKLILAPGASPIVPPIENCRADNVLTLRNLDDTDKIKALVVSKKVRHAVVVGAGYIGLEMVEQLHRVGIEVTLVELMPQLLPLFDPEMAYPLFESLQSNKVTTYLGTSVASFDLQGNAAVAAVLKCGTKITADMFILGIGVSPNTQLAKNAGVEIGKTGGISTDDYMLTSDPHIYAVGDAAEYLYGPTGNRMRVPLAGPANRAGRSAGEHAASGKSAAANPVFGTSIVRVFETTAAMTGLSRKGATRFGIDAASVVIIANNHAGYYPGAQSMTLKLVYCPKTGKIFGAQAVGGEGVDKRIDVIATAMAFGGTVQQLTGVDLTYAPPFGSAKDPVHMAAFAASNQLAGLIQFKDPDTDLSSFQVVDVRTPAEVAKMPLAGAPHAIPIPLDQLRDRLGELDTSRPTVTSCASGLRSYVAARILMQHGFSEVYDLSGAATIRSRALKAAALGS